MTAAEGGYGRVMDRWELRARNWPALAALWVLGSVWISLVVLLALAGIFDVSIPEAVGWTILFVAAFGFVLALAGITVIRTRGETPMAIVALVLALSLTSFASPLLLFGGLGGLGRARLAPSA